MVISIHLITVHERFHTPFHSVASLLVGPRGPMKPAAEFSKGRFKFSRGAKKTFLTSSKQEEILLEG